MRQKCEPKLATILDGHHHPLILTLIDQSSTTDVDIMLTDHNPDALQSHPFATALTHSPLPPFCRNTLFIPCISSIAFQSTTF